MYCHRCGRQYADKAMFCPYCGEKPKAGSSTPRPVKPTLRKGLEASRSQTILGSPGMFKSGIQPAPEDGQDAERRQALHDTGVDAPRKRRTFQQRSKSVVPSRTFVRMRGETDVSPQRPTVEAPKNAPMLAAIVDTLPAPTPSVEATPIETPSVATAPPMLEPMEEPLNEAILVERSMEPVAAAPAKAAIAPREDPPPMETVEPEPQRSVKPPEEKAIELEQGSGLILPSIPNLLGLGHLDMEEESVGVVLEDSRNEPAPAPMVEAPQIDSASGLMLPDLSALTGEAPPPGANEAAPQYASDLLDLDREFPLDAWDEDDDEPMTLLGGGAVADGGTLNADEYVVLSDDNENAGEDLHATTIQARSNADGEAGATSTEESEGSAAAKAGQKKRRLAGGMLGVALAYGVYALFFAGGGDFGVSAEVALRYIPKSSDVTIGLNYDAFRKSPLYGHLKEPLETHIRPIRILMKKTIINAADVNHVSAGFQRKNGAVRHVVVLKGHVDAKTLDAGLKESFSWGKEGRSRVRGQVTFHGHPYEIGKTADDELLISTDQALTDAAMGVAGAGGPSFASRTNVEEAMSLIDAKATFWGVINLTPWVFEIASEWMRVPSDLLIVEDILAVSIDTHAEGITLRLAAVLRDEERAMLIEDLINGIGDRIAPLIASDNFKKEDSAALIAVAKSARVDRDGSSIQFSATVSTETLATYLDTVVTWTMAKIMAFRAENTKRFGT